MPACLIKDDKGMTFVLPYAPKYLEVVEPYKVRYEKRKPLVPYGTLPSERPSGVACPMCGDELQVELKSGFAVSFYNCYSCGFHGCK